MTTPVPQQSLVEALGMAQPAKESRLSLPTASRIPLAGVCGFGIGVALGSAHGSQTAALRFRAEHAHKMPTSEAGWYLYHKSKNYRATRGALREGVRLGSRLGLWAVLAFSLESTIDRCRGQTDMISTVCASVTAAGCFSAWNRFSLPAAARSARIGLLFGIGYGGLQDAISLLKGRPVGYIQFIKRRLKGDASAPALDV
ncbi:hypothetical protein F5X68DRAFT_30479 [Plectosphaerella plurivora]|uniref:Uncharacterized protein n=1 Tax=Plectosphaerella plurivora TaxID=936078 RepID=A0A9P8VJJ2_9PEZI|nr:hypothetical protein F5X68DRAFT_30479 [Plectosphaerella plurivora]